MNEDIKWIIRIITCSMAVSVFAILVASIASSQEIPFQYDHSPSNPDHWYDMSCCSRQDCAPAEPGEVKLTKDGYWVRRKLIPYNDSRVRKTKALDDPRYHICQSKTTERIICLYKPLTSY